MPRRPRGELRGAILDATVELLRGATDPSSISIDAVVSAVGCTPPALYHYFPTKDQLLWEACRIEYDQFAADLEAATPPTADVIGDIWARGEAYVRWARDHPATYQHLFMTKLELTPGSGAAGESPPVPRLQEVPGLGSLVAELDRAVAAGVEVGDPDVTAIALWGVVHGFASLAVTEPAIALDHLLRCLRRALVGFPVPPAGPG